MVAQITVKAKKPIPGIRELPLIGSLHTHNTDRLNLYLRVMHECGDIGQFHYGPYPLVQINTPELVHKVLVEQAIEPDPTKTITIRSKQSIKMVVQRRNVA